MSIEFLILAVILAILAGFLIAWLTQSKKINRQRNSFESVQSKLQEEKNSFESKLLVSQETLRLKSDDLERIKTEQAQLNELAEKRGQEIVGLETFNKTLQEKLDNQKKEIEDLQKRLTAEFENIASKILKERADEFSASNHKNLSQILNPLQEKIQTFEKKVEEAYDKELRDKISLKEEVKRLYDLNTKVSEEANNLTKALKGEVKKQGNWGEIILERVLERSGLTKGVEYEREKEITGSEDQRQRPDVIVHLPDDKHIIIDSKVSLVAYERYSSAETPEQQALFLKEHLRSLRDHVKYLSERNYQNALQVNTPDFVLLFLPIEASFSVAVQQDTDLYTYAWERKIVIVSPSTLLATLRTISSIWKQENQTRNAQEIARLSKALYDKFLSFTEDMNKIKQNLDKASDSYNDAVKKMKDGKGNILRTAEKIKELGGIETQKSLPTDFEVF
ncbi:DNA recombination protein RmuC homolog [uncultured Paludibacter sp.]|uniref:DNA recombination protein RmuC homolog n=1 Tax=uncultured Paludibacter sp. TaxID=497635 RepID=A0A653AJ26_9BACT|nr:DNA recombination protein RmuC homolog [uncultured Paludibacter sp.]